MRNRYVSIKGQKFFWKGLLAANWLIIFGFWVSAGGSLFFGGVHEWMILLGRLAGLSAAYAILLQFFFVGRMPWLERVFGLDRLTRLHHKNGKMGLILLLLHPVLLVLGYRKLTGNTAWMQLTQFLWSYENVAYAALGLTLFIIVVASSIYIVRSRLKYEAWYVVHLIAYLAMLTSFGHQLAVGSTLLSSKIFYGYWIALYVLVFASHIMFRFIEPFLLYRRHQFVITRIERESPTAVSVYITGHKLEHFSVRPGQFMIFRFLTKGRWWQAHPFSLSMMPNGQELRITVKELGDFTKGVKDLVAGTKVFIEGPYGVFTDLFGVSSGVLMIAGGIGITPIRSLLEEMLAKDRDVVLIYGNRFANDIVFKNELDLLTEKYQARIIHVVSDDPDFAGEKGRIDEEKIRRLVPDVATRHVYLCGPPPMMEALIGLLHRLGVFAPQIHYERFAL